MVYILNKVYSLVSVLQGTPKRFTIVVLHYTIKKNSIEENKNCLEPKPLIQRYLIMKVELIAQYDTIYSKLNM